jgi:hypothetical protein
MAFGGKGVRLEDQNLTDLDRRAEMDWLAPAYAEPLRVLSERFGSPPRIRRGIVFRLSKQASGCRGRWRPAALFAVPGRSHPSSQMSKNGEEPGRVPVARRAGRDASRTLASGVAWC